MTARPETPGERGTALTSWPASFVALAAIWGASFLFIKVSVEALAPLQVAFARCAIGALVLLAWLRVSGDRLPRDRRLVGHLFVAGILFCSVPFALFAWAETQVTSVVAGLWNATTPLHALLFLLLLVPTERPTPERVAGLGLGFLGVLVVLGPWEADGGGPLLAQLACFAAAGCYGLGFAYLRRYVTGRSESGVALAAVQLSWASVQLAPFALLGGVPGAVGADVAGSLLALGALGSGVAYVLNFRIVRLAGAATASSVTYVVPLFSTLLGVLALSEPLRWHQPAGALVVLLGVAVSQGRLAKLRRRSAVAG